MLASPTAWLGRRMAHAIGDPERWYNPDRSNDLSDQIATLPLLPTPNASLIGTGTDLEIWQDRRRRMKEKHGNGNGFGATLDVAVRLLPTPCARDDKPGRGYTTGSLPTLMFEDGGLASTGASTPPPSDAGKPSTALRLSPWFVEWMIGAPPGWSDPDCPLSATEFKSRSDGSLGSTSTGSSRSGG